MAIIKEVSNKMKRKKWIINWLLFALLVVLFVFSAILFKDKLWLGNLLQTIGTVSGIYLTIIIFLQSKQSSDKQFREQLEYLQTLNQEQVEAIQTSTEKQILSLQELNSKQIDTLQTLTEKQIKTIQTSTKEQIQSLQELNLKEISAFQELTEKQIEALHKTTYEEISSFETQIREVTNKLADNSILLAELLGRELEKSIEIYSNSISRENAKYDNLSKWKLLRTPQERETQLNNQWGKIEQIRKGYNYLVDKYKNVRKYLGMEQKKLQE